MEKTKKIEEKKKMMIRQQKKERERAYDRESQMVEFIKEVVWVCRLKGIVMN